MRKPQKDPFFRTAEQIAENENLIGSNEREDGRKDCLKALRAVEIWLEVAENTHRGNDVSEDLLGAVVRLIANSLQTNLAR